MSRWVEVDTQLPRSMSTKTTLEYNILYFNVVLCSLKAAYYDCEKFKCIAGLCNLL